jgi:hypothetical protein
MRIPTALVFALLMTFALPVSADAFRSVPDSPVQLQIVRRDGETFLVDISNPSDVAATFDAVGLYFVPELSKSEALAQRLGVVTPGQTSTNGTEWRDAGNVLQLAPHQSVLVKLTSYCLDSQRRSPTDKTQYHLANTRMPASLNSELARVAWMIATLGFDPDTTSGPMQGVLQHATPAATSTLTQQAIWRIRQSSKVSLAGETR